MYVTKAPPIGTHNRVAPMLFKDAGRYLSDPRPNVRQVGWLVAGTLGVISTLVVAERTERTADWAISQLRPASNSESTAVLVRSAFNSADTVRHIRAVLRLSVTELSKLFRVSRQSMHEWSNGGAVSQENGDKLAKISLLADVLAEAQIEVSPYILRRPLSSGKSLLETALSVDDVVAATRKVVTALVREARQREVLAERLSGRKAQSQDLHRYIAPHVAETG